MNVGTIAVVAKKKRKIHFCVAKSLHKRIRLVLYMTVRMTVSNLYAPFSQSKQQLRGYPFYCTVYCSWTCRLKCHVLAKLERRDVLDVLSILFICWSCSGPHRITHTTISSKSGQSACRPRSETAGVLFRADMGLPKRDRFVAKTRHVSFSEIGSDAVRKPGNCTACLT